jgi:tight adherence protein C
MLPHSVDSVDQFIEANAVSLIAVTVFAFVFMTMVLIAQFAQSRASVRRRAVAFNPAHTTKVSGGPAGGRVGAKSPYRTDVEAASELLFAVEKGLSTGSEMRLSKVRRELIRAGYFAKGAIFYYNLTRVILAGLGAYLLHGLGLTLAPSTPPLNLVVLALIGAAVGLLIPALYVRRRHNLLHEQCRNGFPTFLDLLVVCSEAGLTPRAGIERVSREMTRTHPFLGANLFLMNLELRAGRPLVEAVEGLGRRINLDEVRSLGSLLHQTEELGSNLTNALRVFSEEMRARRFFRAEEKAHSLPVKLVLPLALFVFPGMLVVALMPVLMRIQKLMN